MTGNTRLANSKNNIMVGIYFTNSSLTETSQLLKLDHFLKVQIDSNITSHNLNNRLYKYSFVKGFKDKRFSPFTTSELSEINKIWKYIK